MTNNPSTAWVIMTALPFAKGHEDIIRFAAAFAGRVRVLFTPAVGEPHIAQRWKAIDDFCWSIGPTTVIPEFRTNKHSEDPTSEGFWDHWRSVYDSFGFQKGDYVVGGDEYVLKLAEELDGKPIYLPRGNETTHWRATQIRESPVSRFNGMSKFMQSQYRKRVTIFGAESVGKTSLVKLLGLLQPGGTTFPEFARPYLEQNGAELSREKFVDIIAGQVAQKKISDAHPDIPVTFWDTDLLSTIGYLRLNPEFDPYGTMQDAIVSIISEPGYLSDKYFILSQAQVPFEPNELRYGGDKRESDDQFWMNLCTEFEVDWSYISTADEFERRRIVLDYAYKELNELTAYKRPYNEPVRTGLDTP